MAKINVTKPFVLNMDGLHRSFGVGLHGVEDEVAEHWYVKAHSEPVETGDKKENSQPSVGATGRMPPVRTRNQAAKKAQ